MVAIKIDLQAKRCPGGDSEITQAELLIDEVKIVV